jgi:hypothetical protein
MESTAMTVAIAISAANTAAIAAQNARIAKQDRQQCRAFMPSFEAKAATVEQARYYSHCVEVIYPQPLEGSELVWGKIAVVVLILAFIVGIVVGWFKDPYDRLFSVVCGAFFAPTIVFIVGLIGFGIVAGIRFVFS